MIDIHTLNKKLLAELREIAKELGVPRYQKLKKKDLVYQILDVQAKELSIKKKTEEVRKKRVLNQAITLITIDITVTELKITLNLTV